MIFYFTTKYEFHQIRMMRIFFFPSFPMCDHPTSSGTNSSNSSSWNVTWKSNVPNKVKLCAWRAAWDVLPTRANLLKKGVVVDNICLFSSSSPESALHVFNGCPFAKATLFASNIEPGLSSVACSTVLEWLCNQAVVSLSGKFDLLLVLLHSIWRARNLWNNITENPTKVSQLAGLFLSDFLGAQPVPQVRSLVSPSWWSHPPFQWLKINVDGAFNAESKCGGIGVVFRDKAGSYDGGFASWVPHAINPLTAKILATHDGLDLAAQRNCQQVILECDALQVVQAIGSLISDPSDPGLLIEDIKTSLRDFASTRVTHVRKFANVVAYKLALSSNFTSCWYEVPRIVHRLPLFMIVCFFKLWIKPLSFLQNK